MANKIHFSRNGIFLCILLSCTIPVTAQNASAEMVNQDVRFSEYSTVHNTKEAFLKNLDSNGIVFSAHGVARNGLTFWSKTLADTVKLKWRPIYAETDVSETFGYTLGPWVYGNQPIGDTTNFYGIYTSIWTKNSSGEWKLLVDIGVDDKQSARIFNNNGLTTIPVKSTVDASADSNSLLTIDRAFNRALASDGMKAYASSLDKDNMLNRPGHTLFTAGTDVKASVADLPAGLMLTSSRALVPPEASLGVVYGTTTERDHSNAYLRVWRHTKSGWKIAAETILW